MTRLLSILFCLLLVGCTSKPVVQMPPMPPGFVASAVPQQQGQPVYPNQGFVWHIALPYPYFWTGLIGTTNPAIAMTNWPQLCYFQANEYNYWTVTNQPRMFVRAFCTGP